MFTLPFNYNGSDYAALVHERYYPNRKEYCITIMDGELEQLLYGDHILIEKNGEISERKNLSAEKQKLVYQLTSSLSKHMTMQNIF